MYMNDRLQKIRWNLMLHPGEGEIVATRALQDAGFSPFRQYVIAGYFVDIALEEHKLAIEIDHNNKLKKRSQRARQKKIEEQGWTIIRCLRSAPEAVVDAVKDWLERRT